MWEVKERGWLWTGPGTGNPDKQTKVMCQQPKNGDSGPRLGSGTAPGGRKEAADMEQQARSHCCLHRAPASRMGKRSQHPVG